MACQRQQLLTRLTLPYLQRNANSNLKAKHIYHITFTKMFVWLSDILAFLTFLPIKTQSHSGSVKGTKEVIQDSIKLVALYLYSFVCTTGNHFARILCKSAAVYSSLVNFHCYQKCVLWFLSLIAKNQTNTVTWSLSLQILLINIGRTHWWHYFLPPIKIQLPFTCQLAGFPLCQYVDFWLGGFTQTHLDQVRKWFFHKSMCINTCKMVEICYDLYILKNTGSSVKCIHNETDY